MAADGYDRVGLAAGLITPGTVDAHHDAGTVVQAQDVDRPPAWRRTRGRTLESATPEGMWARARSSPTVCGFVHSSRESSLKMTVLRRCAACLLAPLLVLASPAGAGPAAADATSCAGLEVLAHRGVHTEDIDENSLAGFDATASGGWSVETDIRADAEGRLWVFHDRDPSRATGTTGLLDEMTSAEVGALRYTQAGSEVVAFGELLDWMVDHPGVPTYIEPKVKLATRPGGASYNVPRRIVRRLSDLALTDRSWITSFRQALPAAPGVGLVSKPHSAPPEPQQLADSGFDTVTLRPVDMTSANVEAYHQVGIDVQADKSDSPTIWRRAVRAGADAVLTDEPGAVRPDCQATFGS